MTALETLSNQTYVDERLDGACHGSAAEELADIVDRVDDINVDPDQLIANLLRKPATLLREQYEILRGNYHDRVMPSKDTLGTTYERFITRNAEATRVDTEYSLMTTERGTQRLRIASRLQGQLFQPVTFQVEGDDLRITTPGWHRGQPTVNTHSFERGSYGENQLLGVIAVTTLAECMFALRSPEQKAEANDSAVIMQLRHDQQRLVVEY